MYSPVNSKFPQYKERFAKMIIECIYLQFITLDIIVQHTKFHCISAANLCVQRKLISSVLWVKWEPTTSCLMDTNRLPYEQDSIHNMIQALKKWQQRNLEVNLNNNYNDNMRFCRFSSGVPWFKFKPFITFYWNLKHRILLLSF